MLVNLNRQITSLRFCFKSTFIFLHIHVKPIWNTALLRHIYSHTHPKLLMRFFSYSNHITRAKLEGWNIYFTTINDNAIMAGKLASLTPRRSKPHTKYYIIQPAFKHPQQILTRRSLLTIRLLIQNTELPFKHTINATNLLLFTQLQSIIRDPWPNFM
uniref:Uncharacterized protein n=1 Tax=Candidatus Kentrum sp. MB TaxID=2138164 RepID=A0A451BBV0_9GAMM|nr:MAG: hypothetical protein BECKMB1821G_GA0114241_104011 [Candidatus Kentron sp. MB]VFK32230.1 MAG: hypothetical protein BECKMB1821I_GA0114274_103111 [Candidatus Kentron sp. MB]VFK75762.1 MAG: hypothetical protein BECKMB1821H_GA0114242_103111 [Candidatus Kentron sp. MB]